MSSTPAGSPATRPRKSVSPASSASSSRPRGQSGGGLTGQGGSTSSVPAAAAAAGPSAASIAGASAANAVAIGATSSSAGKESTDPPLLVLKVGTSSLMVSDSAGYRVNLANLARLVDLIGSLRRKNYQVVLISSGAVGMGCIKLGLQSRPTSARTKKAVAAAGQSHLMRMYEDLFGTLRLQVAQLLINQSDFLDKDHWSSVKTTLMECLKLGVVPIINENDSTNTEAMRFGDNDNLAALTAVQLEASGLFLFTDVDYLYTANPRTDPDAKPLRIVPEPWALKVDTDAAGSGLGTGGMSTKIVAARTASTAGIPCGLINGQHPGRLHSFLEYGLDSKPGSAEDGDRTLPEGTYFMAMPQERTVGDTRRWILSLPASAELLLDDGCARALANKKSLLPIGILKVTGKFERHECVKLFHRSSEIGRAIINFTSEELLRLRGRHSSEFEAILGYTCPPEACHRGNVILTVDGDSLRSFDVIGKLPDTTSAGQGKTKPIKRNSSFS